MAAWLAAISGLGAIIGGVVYLVKTGVWAFTKTAAETDQQIDVQTQKDENATEITGRPQ